MKCPTLTRRGSRAAMALTLFGSTLILSLGFPSVASALSRSATATPEITSVSLIQAILIGLGYYLSQSAWFFGLGFFTFYRPLVAGFMVGLIMGDPGQGALIGAAINLIYLGFISAGGSIPGDPSLAGWVGTTIALAGGLDYGAALALAVPLGLLGTVIWNGRMTVDSIFVHMADKAADEADISGVVRANIMYPQIFLFFITAVPVSTFIYLGTQFITDLINGFPIWVLSGLAICGGVLPAIGIAMNMRFIFRGSAAPYFFLGYLGIVAGGAQMSIMVLAIVGVALAFLHITLLGDRVSQHAVQKSPSGASNGGGSK